MCSASLNEAGGELVREGESSEQSSHRQTNLGTCPERRFLEIWGSRWDRQGVQKFKIREERFGQRVYDLASLTHSSRC